LPRFCADEGLFHSAGAVMARVCAGRPRRLLVAVFVVAAAVTIDQAAANRSTLLAVIVVVAGGALVLVPSLVLLFRLFLLGRLDPADTPGATVPRIAQKARTGMLPAFACAIATFGLTATAPDEET
jgi:hypothetical protein